MPRTLDELVQDTFGAQALTICRLQAELSSVVDQRDKLAAQLKEMRDGKPPTDAADAT
jgi:chaperonin cofactor prefoldin